MSISVRFNKKQKLSEFSKNMLIKINTLNFKLISLETGYTIFNMQFPMEHR